MILKSFYKFSFLVKYSSYTNNALIIPEKNLLEIKELPQILFRLQKRAKWTILLQNSELAMDTIFID